MKIVLRFFIVVFFTLNGFCDDLEFDIADGKIIYEETCISCHGPDGLYEDNLNLVVKPRNLSKSILNKEQIYKIVRDGSHVWGSKSDIMASYKNVYSDDELKSVSTYVFHTFLKGQSTKINTLLNDLDIKKQPSLEVGKKIFLRNCSLCHGLDGSGESEFVEKSKSNKNFIYPYNLKKILLDEEQIFLYTKYGGKFWGAYKNDMPAWKRKYDDYILKSVAKYIKEVVQK
jgi:mono/diheme cytochrome c family protein